MWMCVICPIFLNLNGLVADIPSSFHYSPGADTCVVPRSPMQAKLSEAWQLPTALPPWKIQRAPALSWQAPFLADSCMHPIVLAQVHVDICAQQLITLIRSPKKSILLPYCGCLLLSAQIGISLPLHWRKCALLCLSSLWSSSAQGYLYDRLLCAGQCFHKTKDQGNPCLPTCIISVCACPFAQLASLDAVWRLNMLP